MNDGAFESRAITIAGLLGEDQTAQIRIPEFQRGYSWDSGHIESFWDDLVRFLDRRDKRDGPTKYFLGPIVTLVENEGFIELLDGQQRVATATVLFSAMVAVARKNGTKEITDFATYTYTHFIKKLSDEGIDVGKVSLLMGETDAEYFRKTIQTDPPIETVPLLKTHVNIKAAFVFFNEKLTEKLSELPLDTQKLQFLNKLRVCVQRDLVMARIPVDSEEAAFTIFETLNDRGLRLSVPDLLLSYLMREAKDKSSRPQIRAVWTEMIERMGKRDIQRFIRHMWVSKYGDLKSIDLFLAIKKLVEESDIDSLAFAQSCLEECELYSQILDVDEKQLTPEAAKYVFSLVRTLNFAPSFPVLLSAYKSLDTNNFSKVAQWLLVAVTRYSIIAQKNAAKIEDTFYLIAREIRKRMEAQGEDNQKAGACMAYVKQQLTALCPPIGESEEATKSLILTPGTAKYFVNRLAIFMQQTSELKFSDTNVEHVYPRKPEANEWGGAAGQALLSPFLWHVGNLTIFGRRLNRVAANKEYAIKRPQYETKTDVEMTKKIAKDFQTWTVADIQRRGRDLSVFVRKIWDFENSSMV